MFGGCEVTHVALDEYPAIEAAIQKNRETQMRNYITEEYVIEELDSAGRTAALERVGGLRPRGHMAFWPEIVREKFVDHVDAEPAWILPAPKAISQNRKAHDWMIVLAKYCHQKNMLYVVEVVWKRHEHKRCAATGKLYPKYGHKGEKSWRALGRELGCHDATAKSWYEDGIRILTRILNGRI